MSLTIQQVAEQVNVSTDTVRAAIKRGDLEAWRPGPGVIRVEPEAIEVWKRRKPVQRPTLPDQVVDRLKALEGGRR